MRLGCYGPTKTLIGANKENPSLVRNIAAGAISGSFASLASNPIDLVKTRLQSKENPYRTSTEVIRGVIQTEGVLGLWRGTVPAMVRRAQ